MGVWPRGGDNDIEFDTINKADNNSVKTINVNESTPEWGLK